MDSSNMSMEDVDRAIKPLEERVGKVESVLEGIRKDLPELTKKADLRDLVVDKTNAMKGELIAWILGTAIVLAGILKFVPGPGG